MSQSIKTFIELSGMTCNACERLIGKRLSKISGVTQVEVNLKDEDAQVEGSKKITEEEIKSVLEGTDYKVISVH